DWETQSCTTNADCPFSRSCEAGLCKAQSCQTDDPWDKPKGSCPSGTYCAVRSLAERRPTFKLEGLWPVVDDYFYLGSCEGYIPVVISPYLFEIFNTIAAPTLGLPRIDKQAVLGLKGGLHFGASYMKSNYNLKRQTLRRVELVGFSSKAIDLGLTMPLPYVKRFNALYREMIGEERLSQFDSVILELKDKRSMPMLLSQLQKMEYTLSSKSQQGAEIRNFIFIITIVFGLISGLILTISAVNITHTFLMIVSERKREIGILRSIGASKNDIRQIILTEAAGIGLLGGCLGLAAGWGLSRLCNFLFAKYIPYFPYKPDNFFQFDALLIVGAIVFALVFCLLGAFLPANRATKLDPANALTVH
ncbi:MAG: FtsX-like permease family protein, partial [Myxococcales bacterium]|nr:FtsX-like permease family protein [Myxococcales bacterium]